ncbi:LOW QUALITY PROTEIN: serine protease 55 [Rhynchocyon petersi]
MLLLSIFLLISRAKSEHFGMWTPLPMTRADHRCGERSIFEGGAEYSRIIQGVEAGVGEFPWLVSIQAGSEHFCGGAILNKWWILTAAHCLQFEAISPVELNIVMGTNDLTSPHKEIKQADKIVLHRNFKKTTMDNDVALLMVTSPITFTDKILPICLPRHPIPSTWNQCWVAGWGKTKTGDRASMTPTLMKAPMVITDWEECSKMFTKLTQNMLCAGFKNESYDACQGDSGGPLVCTPGPGKKWYQVGIISWGRSCGKNFPGIYTLLAKYDDWIKRVTEVEGRPFNVEDMKDLPQKNLIRSQASEFPESNSPRVCLLLCLLPYLLLWPILNS